SDQDALTPQVFLVRHGETEWAKSGRFIGIIDIKLTKTGIAYVLLIVNTFIEVRKFIDLSYLLYIFSSPKS
ncbi:hypothetical protein COCSADRAFT_98572, partial [Bipolaris sorokiniana ND90Pr]